ncbi:TolC family protein [Flavobacterium sp. J49]|uniref:TolC family protein n=1 Tax=Flavobacterium sp. J49 TaxID=2718534 RepID=UPI001593FADD|nr:TolC family protein [Flavobacterium sp. J49]MBF6642545.1 TolC family protein [Flavobacterium sp. J49]NIC03791.1 TolC family protein [Flavobacterium sp. J49]
MKLKSLYSLFLLLVFVPKIQSQALLKLEDAVKIALENNYDIKLAKNELTVDELNNTIGNAGMLPTINATVVNNNSILNTTQTQADGSERTLDGARNMNLTYGVGLDWTVFDGMRMFARKEQLNILQKQGEAELKLAILTRISDVYLNYFDLVQQQQQLAAIDTAIVISQERVNTAQNRFSIGKASKLEVLNAQVDLNSDKSLQLKQQELIKTTKIRLNEILARDVQTDFTVTNEISVDEQLKYDDLKSSADSQNPQLQAQLLTKNSAEQQLKQVKAGRYPTVRITSGYNFTRSEASLGFVTQSSGRGLVYGINASVPIFNGNLQNRNEKIAKVQLENANITLEQQKRSLESQLNSAFTSYITNLELSKVEAKNLEIAKQNLDITLAKFKIGTITPIEFRTAQQNFLDARVRYSNAMYLTKIYEITLKELAGNLSF